MTTTPTQGIDPGWRISVGRDEAGTWSVALSREPGEVEPDPQVWQLVWDHCGYKTRDEAIEAARRVAAECDERFEAQVAEEAAR